jgi:hypothetical protein
MSWGDGQIWCRGCRRNLDQDECACDLDCECSTCEREANFRQPEKRLALAVLEDGVKCYQGGGVGEDGQYRSNRTARLQREAVEWIADVAADGPFSFNGCCATLGIDAGYLRAGVLVGRGGPIARRSGAGEANVRVTANKRRVRHSSP